MDLLVRGALCALLAFIFASHAAAVESIRYQPRPIILGKQLSAWDFLRDAAGWGSASGCGMAAKTGVLRITSTSEDPHIVSPRINVQGPLVVQMRIKCATAGSGQIFWTTKTVPRWTPQQSQSFHLKHDEQWHEYQILIDADEVVTQLRFDPGSGPGYAEIEWIRLSAGRLHPIEIQEVRQSASDLVVELYNHDSHVIRANVNGEETILAADAPRQIHIPFKSASPFEMIPVTVAAPGLPDTTFTVCAYHDNATGDWIRCAAGGIAVELAPDGSGARLSLDGQRIGLIAPLVRMGNTSPKLAIITRTPTAIHLRGEGVDVVLDVTDGLVNVRIDSASTVEGPVVRLAGTLKQGLLPGVEYLGAGERSSSTLDIETPDHWRVRPDPLSVTMPLMACVTEKAGAALLWDDPSLQPVFASPDFLDGSADHRMALEGKRITATLLLARQKTLEDLIVWAVNRRGLPPLPERPRDDAAERRLNLAALTQSVAGDGGWGHAAEARWERKPYSDIASAIGWLTGKFPELPRLESGGSHIRDDAIYFVSGRAKEWLGQRTGEVRSLLAQQQADGSFRYDGPLRRGHHENTASGYNAWRATTLLEFARTTGDRQALEGGIRCLDFMKHFQTPRGAQTHELPLHTPDLLGAAYLVRSYTRGYELTGNPDYLAAARKWAISGVPFVYQWSRLPTMAYATIPAIGATQWVEPDWIGLPVQWCGGVYGYALAMLQPHDATLDWDKIAKGILIAGEQMQYPDGPLAGCLPDFFLLREQRRAGPSLNPGVLLSLQRAIDQKVSSLAVAVTPAHRVTSPFPVAIEGGQAVVEAPVGQRYQVLIDGKRIVEVTSTGRDRIDLRLK